MKRPSLAELSAGTYDLVVVGGGIVGCGVARDAALRGLRVALVEQHDFGSGTTSRSTRLIHGGLRYLELYDFGLVREDLRERETLMCVAPHLVRPLPFLIPMYRLSAYQRLRLRAGMLLYDALSFDKSLPGHRFLSREETLAAEPNLDPRGLRGAARYFDAQVALPERLCLENALDAAAHGAMLRNYTRSERFLIERDRIAGIEVRDAVSGERASVTARLIINATGAWLDRTLAEIRPSGRPLLRTTRGVHLVTERLGPNAVVLFARSDGRLFFVVPWLGLSLIGTTDTDEPDRPENVRADPDDLGYLLDEARRAFPGLANLSPCFSMAGVRALVPKAGIRASEVSRRHALLDHGREGGPDGLLSIVGGKMTGYRAIAQDAVNLVSRKLGHGSRCTTGSRPLPGAPADQLRLANAVAARAERLGLSAEQQRYLLAVYGRRAGEVLALAEARPDLVDEACSGRPTILAEVVHAAREESALNLEDILLRRTPLGFAADQGLAAAPLVAETLGRELGWDAVEQAAQVERYREHVRRLYAMPTISGCARRLAGR